jgi:hypothetical protein
MARIYRVAYRVNGLASLKRGTKNLSRDFTWIPGVAGSVQFVEEHSDDAFGTEVPGSIRIVFETAGESVDEIRAIADTAADIIARLLCFQAGGGFALPRPLSALDVTPGVERRMYHQWLYGILEARPTRRIDLTSVEILAHSFGARDQRIRDACARALKWYTDALNEVTLVDRFTKAWIGLECIGKLLEARAHKAGWEQCKVCVRDQTRNRKDKEQDRGIRHVLSVVETKKPIFDPLKIARHKIVHGDWTLEKVQSIVNPHAEQVVAALAAGILSASAPPNVTAKSREAYGPEPPKDRGADARLDIELLSVDPNVWGELSDKVKVSVELVGSSFSKDIYHGETNIRAVGDIPCELGRYQIVSLREGDSGMELTIPLEPKQLKIERVRVNRSGQEVISTEVR